VKTGIAYRYLHFVADVFKTYRYFSPKNRVRAFAGFISNLFTLSGRANWDFAA
jgi:hypothetical protein